MSGMGFCETGVTKRVTGGVKRVTERQNRETERQKRETADTFCDSFVYFRVIYWSITQYLNHEITQENTNREPPPG